MAPEPEGGVMAICAHVSDSCMIAAAAVSGEPEPSRSQMQNLWARAGRRVKEPVDMATPERLPDTFVTVTARPAAPVRAAAALFHAKEAAAFASMTSYHPSLPISPSNPPDQSKAAAARPTAEAASASTASAVAAAHSGGVAPTCRCRMELARYAAWGGGCRVQDGLQPGWPLNAWFGALLLSPGFRGLPWSQVLSAAPRRVQARCRRWVLPFRSCRAPVSPGAPIA